ncbi:MAG: tRNA pseudouridine synthase A, partial [Alcaligenaceae bacterium]|nr:tRNA pseudouridine synthase A [Alcaligenaceae bacterium]
MARIALGLAYDGSPWQGWQTQPGGRTVQDRLEAALASFLAQPVATICAGRTDTGVHALEQVVHLDSPVERRMESWTRGLNASLPPSIRVQWACQVADDFHARFSARSRSYVYLLRSHRVASPILHGKTGWIHRPLELNRMREAAGHLLGEH